MMSIGSSIRVTKPAARARLCVALVLAGALAGCEVVKDEAVAKKRDTGVAAPRASAGQLPGDSALSAPVAPTPGAADSAALVATAADSGIVEMFPLRAARGGVLFALARGLTMSPPRCGWNGKPLPCAQTSEGVLAIVPLPAELDSGTYILTMDRPVSRLERRVPVADRQFGQELIFLDAARYALTTRTREIARDARAVRAVVSAETPERFWTGRWRDPIPLGEATGYGVERFYYPASDSARAITLDPTAHARGVFAADTVSGSGKGVPSWRHAGLDIPARRGALVAAPASGRIADVGEYVLTGRTLVVDHGQGVFTAYFHLDTVLVQKGDLVKQGAPIGRVGSTGLATGPHLHYGVYVHGQDVDPRSWKDMPEFARGPERVAGR
jgi:peptidase M23-like protein